MLRRLLVSAVVALALGLVTAGEAHGQLFHVKDLYLRFETTGDDREGGTIKVELWSGRNVVHSHTLPEAKFGKNSRHEFTLPVNKAIPLDGIVARVTLTDAREVNIRWTFHTGIELRGGVSNVEFARNNVVLDTTGPGYPRSSHADIQRTK